MRILYVWFLALIAAVAMSAAPAAAEIGNLGYNSYEGFMTGGTGLNRHFGPGVGYPSENGDYFHRYIPADKWGKLGYGTGHLGQGWGPYIFAPREGSSPPGLYDIPQPAYADAPPPSIKVRNGSIYVNVADWVPGIRSVTVTVLAYNGAELVSQVISDPPFNFNLPVMDGSRHVRVHIDYANNGLSATSYPL